MSVSVDLQSQLLQYIKAMKKPLLFVAKNDYASIGAVRDLGPTLITVLEKAQELPFSSAQKDLLASVRDAFQSYETQAVEAKIACIASGLQSLRDLERLLSAPPSPTRADRTEASQSSQPRSAAPARTSSARLEERGGPTKDRIPPSRIKDEAALRPEAARQEGADERRKPESTETGRDDATRRTDRNRDVKGVVSREQRPTPAPANRSNQKTEQRPAEKVFQSAPYKERGDQDPSWGRLRREAAPELEPLFFLPLPDEDDPLAETTETVTTPPPSRSSPQAPPRPRAPALS